MKATRDQWSIRRTGSLPKRLHLVGICGQGLTALAGLLKATGHSVTGCDRQTIRAGHDLLHALAARLGVPIEHPNHPDHVLAGGCDAVVAGSYVPDDLPELSIARQLGIPVLRREEALGLWLRDHSERYIAIAGVMGKSTTTTLVAHALSQLGHSTTEYIGAWNPNRGGDNFFVGSGPLAVFEACEFKSAFLHLPRSIAVVTNMVWGEHTDCFVSPEAMAAEFAAFISTATTSIVNVDDPPLRQLARLAGGHVVRVGTDPRHQPDVHVRIEELTPTGSAFTLISERGSARASLPIFGRHNVMNVALATAAVSLADDTTRLREILGVLQHVQLPGRRLEVLAEDTKPIVIDDYGHHPEHIRAGYQAVRQRYPKARMGIIFQPSVFRRTFDLIASYIECLRPFDIVIVDEISVGSYDVEEDLDLGDTGDFVAALQAGGVAALRRRTADVLRVPHEFLDDVGVVVVSGARRSGAVGRHLVERLRS